MKPQIHRAPLLICFILIIGKISFSQDYVVTKKADTLRGTIKDCTIRQVKFLTDDGKKMKLDPSELDAFYYASNVLLYRSRTLSGKKQGFFLPVPKNEKFISTYSDKDDKVLAVKSDSLVLYRITQKMEGVAAPSGSGGSFGGSRTTTFRFYILVESPSYGLAVLSAPEMSEPDYEEAFQNFKKYFTGSNPSLVERFIYARNENVRKTQTLGFMHGLLQDYFGEGAKNSGAK